MTSKVQHIRQESRGPYRVVLFRYDSNAWMVAVWENARLLQRRPAESKMLAWRMYLADVRVLLGKNWR